jgi:hypothetical protein
MSTISAGTSNTTSLVYTGDTTGNLAFQINGTTEAMRITSGGKVGIGIANPVPAGTSTNAVLHINASSSNQAQLKLTNGTSGSTGNDGFDLAHDGTDTFLSNRESGSTYIYNNNTKSITTNQYGLGLGTATPISGTGIAFPASQNASGNPNTLDDYEEGTWTPVNASIGNVTVTSSGPANYVKIGRLVYISFYVGYSSNSDTNQAKIGGFPFASASGEIYGYFTGRAGYSGKGQVVWQLGSGNTEANAYGSTTAAVNNNDVSGTYVIVSGCYISNS